MLVLALACPGDRGDDVELGYANRLSNVPFVLAEEAPEDGGKPRSHPSAYAFVNVVLVMPQLVGELLALHRQRDRDDDIGKPSAELIPCRVAWEAQTKLGVDRRPADGANTPAGREDRDEMVAVRLTELEDRRHRGSGPDEFRRLRRLGC